MPSLTTTYDRIIRQPALTMPGNATGSEAACTALTGSQIRAICGLGTTDNVTFNTLTATTSVLTPLVNNASAALTLGNATHGVTVPGAAVVSGDISMQKATQGYIYAYNPLGTNYGRFYTSNANETHVEAQTYLILRGGSTGIVEVSKSGVTAKVRVYDSGTTKYTDTYHDGTNGILSTNSGALVLDPANDIIGIGGIGVNDPALLKNSNKLAIRNGNNSAWVTIQALEFEATYGRLYSPNNVHAVLEALATGYPIVVKGNGSGSGLRIIEGTNTYSIDIKPIGSNSIGGVYTGTGTSAAASGALADWHCAAISCAGITASGAIQETYRTSSLDPTVSDIGSGKRQGWYNTTATEFRDWVNVGGTLYKSAAYT